MHLPPAAYGFPQGRAIEAPLLAVDMAIRRLSFGVDPMALSLAASPLILGLGFERILGRHPLAWGAAALFASVNPFVDERLGAGAFWFVLAADTLPFILSAARIVATGSLASSVRWALVTAIGAALAPQMLFMSLIASTAVVISERWRRPASVPLKAVLSSCLTGIALLVVLSAYWLVPTAKGGFAEYAAINTTNLPVFATVATLPIGLFGNLLALYGFWRPVAPLASSLMPGWPLLLLAVLVVVAMGLSDLYKQRERRQLAVTLAVSGLVGVLMAAGSQGVTGPLFVVLFRNVPGFKAFREPEQALILLVVFYAACFGAGAAKAAARCRTWPGRSAVAAVILALPLAYSATQVWGLELAFAPTSFPKSWSQIQKITSQAPGTILALPWSRFTNETFTGGRNVDNPAADYFSDPVLSSRNDGLPALGDDSTDPREKWMLHVLRNGPDTNTVGRLLAPLGVRWVLLAPLSNSGGYQWLYHQSDLTLVQHWRGAALFLNRAWSGEAYIKTANGAPKPLPILHAGATSIAFSQPPPPRSEIILTLPYAPGWEMGGTPARLDPAGTMLFSIQNGTSDRAVFGPWEEVRVADGASLAAALSGSIVVIAARRRRKWIRSPTDVAANPTPSET